MNLQQMILEVRRAVDEPQPDFFTDQELTDWLNEGAKIMASDAQPLQTVYQFTTTNAVQEYPLPQDTDEIFGVSYYRSSTLYQLRPVDVRVVQFASVVTSLPVNFYLRSVTNQLAPQTTSGIVPENYATNPTTYGLVLGLYPLPSNSTDTVTVSYYAKHNNMRFPYDVSPIPLEFHRGIVAYSIAMAKGKDSAYGEMNNVYLPLFQQFKDRLKEKMANRGQEMEFPKMKINDESPGILGGSSVIIVNNGAS